MKTTISGNGVTVANRFKVVRTICGKNSWMEYKITPIKASDLTPIWNYRAEGLNLDQAKQQLIDTIKERVRLGRKSGKGERSFAQRHNPYLRLYQEKKSSIASFLKLFETSEHANNYFRYSYGQYSAQHRTFQLPGTNTPYPIIVKVQWTEDHDWNHYAKSYHHPKSTYTNREVVFKTIGKLGQVVEIFKYPLATFAGAFMEKAIAAYFGITKVKCSKELKPIQLADYFELRETNAINGYRLFQRYIGLVLWDYAILDTKTGNTYHAYEQEKLVPGLRAKLQAKFDHENQVITKQTGYDLHFCQTGMQNFCEDNNLDFEGQYTRVELRNIVIQRRADNYRKYRIELAQVGITLGA